jgi:putative transposase
MLIVGERHLPLVRSKYTDHDNLHRPDRALQHSQPAGRAHPPAVVAGYARSHRDRLGGLIHEYAQVKWGATTSRDGADDGARSKDPLPSQS